MVIPDRETGHPDLPEEQRFLDRSYEGLEAMRGEATRMLRSVLDVGRGGTFQSRTERDIVVRTSLARLAQLDIGDEALCFGRIDRLVDQGQALESFHIGRLAVSGPDHEPLVVDWRAPVAEPFYRATGLDPQGLARRRHLAVRDRRVTGLEDEYFVSPTSWPGGHHPLPDAAGGAASGQLADEGLVLGGPAALLSALGASRTGRMGDIVATIQREQDEIIRSPLAGVLTVQGGPGTGKTAVALHRAAYLLYTHRFPLERQGVLVVGPNPLFLRYIEQVLPSLGESGVTLSTVNGLVPEIRARHHEPDEVARLKGDPRMVGFIARAVRTRERPLRRDVAIPFGATVLHLRAEFSAEAVAATRRRRGTHNARRRFLENLVVRRLGEHYEAVRRRRGLGVTAGQESLAGLAQGPGDPLSTNGAGTQGAGDQEEEGSGLDLGELRRQLRRVPAFVEAMDRMWPRLDPHELIHDLFGAQPLLAVAGRGLLSPHEQHLLHRPRAASLDQVRWTPADAALVDEARVHLGPRRGRGANRGHAQAQGTGGIDLPEWAPGGGVASMGATWDAPTASPGAPERGAEVPDEHLRSYGHIVVDEVQGLSPMQLRMLARRSLSGSMTVVGDIAQATGASSADSWETVAEHLSPDRPVRQVELTVSYRTPAEVMEVAAPVLAQAVPGLAPPRPVRRSGVPPVIARAEPSGLLAKVASTAAAEVAAVEPGRVAVVAPRSLLPSLHRTLAEAGLDPVDPRDRRGPGLGAPLVVLEVEAANGLEFDSVVVVEPALVAGGQAGGEERPGPPSPRGLRALYVALTRPTRRLAVVHAQPLPAALEVLGATC